jgi:competence protein ComEC
MTGLPPNLHAIPALIVAVSFAAGIIASNAGAQVVWLIGLMVIATALMLITWWRGRRRIVKLTGLASMTALLSAVVLAGALRYEVTQRAALDDIRRWITEDEIHVVVYGRVGSTPLVRGSRTRFELRVDSVSARGRTASAAGRLMVNRDGDWAMLRLGEGVRIHGMLALPARARNPADFDYRGFLARQGIYGMLYSRETDQLAIVHPPDRSYDRWLGGLRSHIRTTIDQHVSAETSRHIVRALTLGDRSGLSHDDRERFARSGLMHLLAVSGLHVMLVGMVIYGLLRPTLMRMRLSWEAVEISRSALTILLLVTYMLVTGNSPSVVRAVVMASIFIIGMALQRRSHPLNTLGVAALILLAIRPTEVFQPGFQLSFSAVTAIILARPIIPTKTSPPGLHPAFRYAGQSVAVSLAATLGTLPVLLYHFGRASFAGLLLNLGAIPITAGLLSSSLMMLLTSPIGSISTVFGATADALARLLLHAAGIGDAWSQWMLIDNRVENPMWLAALALAAAMPSLWLAAKIRWKAVVTLSLLVTLGWGGERFAAKRESMDILFFDVGQADAALLRFPNGKTLLVDAGRREFRYDSAERVIGPHLRRAGIPRIDAVLITHPHNDHLGGLPYLLRNVPIGRVIDNGDDYDSNVFRETLALIDTLGLTRQSVSTGDTLLIDPQVRIKILSPAKDFAAGVNDRSIVLRITYGEVSVLLTGDAETHAERFLKQYFPELLSSKLVKAGHHGSSTSSTPRFVDFTMKEAAMNHVVISVGQRNRYRHPSSEVVQRWTESGVHVHQTSMDGAVWFRTNGRSLEPLRWRD